MPYLMVIDHRLGSTMLPVHSRPSTLRDGPVSGNNITLEDIERWANESGLPTIAPDAALAYPLPLDDRAGDAAWPGSDPITALPNETLARLLRGLAFASIAYCPDNDTLFDGHTEGSHFIKSFHSASTDIYAYIAVQNSQQSIVIAFRGTQSLLNWFNDFKFFTRTLPWKDAPQSAFVHRGFFNSYASISTELIRVLTDVVFPVYPAYSINIVGHSLGGTMAILCALDLKANVAWKGPISVLTYGQPRVGNANFTRYYDSYHVPGDETIRVVNYADIIAHVPPLRLGYVHRTRETWIQSDGQTTFLCSRRHPEDSRCSYSLSPSQYSIVHHRSAWNISFGLCA